MPSADVDGVLGHVEADAHVALRAQVVDLVRAHAAQRAVQRAAVVEIAVEQAQAVVGDVRVLVDVVDALGVERARAPDEAVDLVALGEQQLRQVRPVLAGDARDQALASSSLDLLSMFFVPVDVRRNRRRTRSRASKPNRSRARVTSRRGAAGRSAARVPDELALEPAARARSVCARSRIAISSAAAQVHRARWSRSAPPPARCRARVLDVQELARRRAVAPQHDLAVARAPRADELADHRRDHVGRLQVEVVARAVQVHREQHDAFMPYCCRYACDCTSSTFLAMP